MKFLTMATLLTTLFVTNVSAQDTLKYMVLLSPPEDSALVATNAIKWGLTPTRYLYGVMNLTIPLDSLKMRASEIIDSLEAIRRPDGTKAVDGAQWDKLERLDVDIVDTDVVDSTDALSGPMSIDYPSWGQDSLRIKYPLSQGTTGAGVRIAILDTGFEINRPEFAGRVVACVKVNPGIDSITPLVCRQQISSCNHHGTHVASTAGGATRGIAPEAELVLVNIYVNISGCVNQVSDRIVAARFVHDVYGAKIINLSTGGTGAFAENTAHNELRSKGVIFCSATGNSGASAPAYPAAFPADFGIGGLTSALAKGSYSQYGTGLDFMFPGTSINGATGASSFGDKTGTSMAAPHCAGTAALVRQILPQSTADEVYEIFKQAALDRGAVGFDAQTGWGMPRADRAVAIAKGMTMDPIPSSQKIVLVGPFPKTECVSVNSPVEWTPINMPAWATYTRTMDELCITVNQSPGSPQQQTITLKDVR